MPHTNRKKKAPDEKTRTDSKEKNSHSKREYISSEDGWTQVTDKRWKSITSKIGSNEVLENPLAEMTLEEIAKEYTRYKEQWESSNACAELKNILSTKNNGRCKVENAVCLGLGSLQALPMEWRRSSHTQLAALVTISDILHLKCQVVMQEPRFTDLDQAFLESIDCEVVMHPDAFQRINKASLVYAIHCPFQLLWNVKERAYPALLIANQLRDRTFGDISQRSEVGHGTLCGLVNPQNKQEGNEEVDRKHYVEACSLQQGCEEIAFPELRNDFSDTIIYWRQLPQNTNSEEALVTEKS